MTTYQRPFSRRPTANNQAAQIRSATRRTCPQCGRRAALLTRNLPVDVLWACRWCPYAVLREY